MSGGRPNLTKHRSKACLKSDMTMDVLTYVEEVIHVKNDESLLLLEGSITPAERAVREEEKRHSRQSKRNVTGGAGAAAEARTPPGRGRRPSISDVSKGFAQSVKGFSMSGGKAVRSASQTSDTGGGSDTELSERGAEGEEEDVVPPMLDQKSPSSMMLGTNEFKPMNRTDSFINHGGA